MTAAPHNLSADATRVLERARAFAERREVFDRVEVTDGRLVVHAAGAPEEVFYRIELEDGAFYVAWVSEDRYVSQSIEAELMWTGDDLDDIIDEELVDTDWERGAVARLEHFRNDEQLFIFRSRLPFGPADSDPEKDAEQLVCALLAYEAAFRELGDMKPDDDEI